MNEALFEILESLRPGAALDLACGSGRHTRWLRERGWAVTPVDLAPAADLDAVVVDLETLTFDCGSSAWDLILCWLYWQPSLLPKIARGLKSGGIAALAGKTTGRFATSLQNYREAFPGWRELSSGNEADRCWCIFIKP